MNPFTRHPRRQGVGFMEHWCFAMGIAYRLLQSAAAFGVHAVFPFIPISRQLDLESTTEFLRERNAWIETASGLRGQDRDPGVPDERISDFGDDLPPGGGEFDSLRLVPETD